MKSRRFETRSCEKRGYLRYECRVHIQKNAQGISTCALSLLHVILKVTKYCVLWVKMNMAWLLLDGIVSFCAHLCGIRWVRIFVSLAVIFFALHHVTHTLHTSSCAVGGVGLITSSCTCIDTSFDMSCYATGHSLAVAQMKEVATLNMLLC